MKIFTYYFNKITSTGITDVSTERKQKHSHGDEIDQLNSDVQSIERKYAQLQTSTRESLKDRSVPCMRLKAHLLAYRNFRGVTRKESTLLLSDRQRDLEKAESIDEIFVIVCPFWSFLDYEILEDIINSKDLGADSDQQNLAVYTTNLRDFLHSWRVEPRKVCRDDSVSPGSRVKLHFKLDTNSLSMYRDVKIAIARILDIQVSALQLCSIEEGCTELVFLCPNITPSLPLSDEKKEELFRIIPPVLKVVLGFFNIEIVLFEVCAVYYLCAIVNLAYL